MVCSNSFRSDDGDSNAVGLLHREKRTLGSIIMREADVHKVPAGSALLVMWTKTRRARTTRSAAADSVEAAMDRDIRASVFIDALVLLALACLLGVLLPSSTLTWVAIRWAQRHRERRGLRAFRQGMAPLVVGLICSTGWVLAGSNGSILQAWPLWCVAAVTALIVWRTKLHLLWLLSIGAVLGALGVI